MSIGNHLQQWCDYRQFTQTQLSEKTGIARTTLELIQQGTLDPPLSVLDSIAQQLNIPTAWLHYDPRMIQRLWNDPDDEEPELPDNPAMDPIFARMIQVQRQHPEVFILLTNLVHYGDPQLIRAAQVNLQSLSKQIRRTTLPWGSRPSGHFEPPSE